VLSPYLLALGQMQAMIMVITRRMVVVNSSIAEQ
jgi:hypothetical protein